MRMRFVFVGLAVIASSAGAQSDSAAQPRIGQVLKTSGGVRIGAINRLNADGSAQVIYGERFVTIPAGSIQFSNGALTTTLSRRDVDKLAN